MLLRGFRGEFYYVGLPKARGKDWLFFLGSLLLFLAARNTNLPELLGSLFMR